MLPRILMVAAVVVIGVVLSQVRISIWEPHTWWVALILSVPEVLWGIYRDAPSSTDSDEDHPQPTK